MSGATGSRNGDGRRELDIYNFRLDSARRNLELLTSLHTSLRTRNSNLAALREELSTDRSEIRRNLEALEEQIKQIQKGRMRLNDAVNEKTPGMMEIKSSAETAFDYVDQLKDLIEKAGKTAREIQVRHLEPAHTEPSHVQLVKTIRDGWDKLEDLEHDKSSTIQHRWGELPKLGRYWTEYLDFVAGLSLRHEDLDQGLSDIADAMTRELQGHSDSLSALAIPGREGSLGILPKIVYLRFPEWTAWSLPLAAHELWLIAAESKAAIATTFYSRAASDLRNSPDALKLADDKERSLRPGKEIKPLLADVFATFTLGPAYAWSALLLGLDPAAPDSLYRSQAIFHALDRLAGGANGKSLATSLGKDRQELARFWQSAVEQAGGKLGPLPDGMTAWLNSLLDHLQSLQRLAFSTEQWDSAWEDWVGAFTSDVYSAPAHEAQNEITKKLDALEPRSIRFALNAVWKARLLYPEKADQIAARCRELCKKLAMGDSTRRPSQPSPSQQRWNSSAP